MPLKKKVPVELLYVAAPAAGGAAGGGARKHKASERDRHL